MNDEYHGFLISVIIMMGIVIIFAIGAVKHSPCDFYEVGMYYDTSYEEMIECP
jgi:hypothetical protein